MLTMESGFDIGICGAPDLQPVGLRGLFAGGERFTIAFLIKKCRSGSQRKNLMLECPT